jgi:hypothetical protein
MIQDRSLIAILSLQIELDIDADDKVRYTPHTIKTQAD